MNLYPAVTGHDQGAGRTPVQVIFAAAAAMLLALDNRRRNAGHIRYLRSLDRHALNDMGVDIAKLGENRPTLLEFNPYAVTTSTLLGSLNLPVDVNSR